MKNSNHTRNSCSVIGFALSLALCGVACSSPAPHTENTLAASSAPTVRASTLAPAEEISQAIDILPFPYSGSLPPASPSPVDGVYTRTIQFEGTPTPCKRCAEYRLEGGEWIMSLDRGVFKVFHPATGFKALGSFVIAEDHLTLFNDPNCEEDMRMRGIYAWSRGGNSLTLKVIDDPCSIGLRAKNLTATPWERVTDPRTGSSSPCDPPSIEAAITDHWKKPAGCGE